MDKYNTLNNYDYAKLMLDDKEKFDYIEILHVYQYLTLLESIEDKINKLDMVDQFRAEFNEKATSLILSTIIDTISNNKKLAIDMMDSESIRLRKVLESYDSEKNLERLSRDEMKNILLDYMGEEEVEEKIEPLYNYKVYNLKNENKK